MNLLIHNVRIFTNNDRNALLENHAVAIEGTRIIDVGPEGLLQQEYSDARPVNGGGRLLMPGFINTHMHFYSTFSRGLALPGVPKNFHEVLEMLWWRLDRSLNLEACYYSALLPAMVAAKKGVTAIIDHHASAQAVDGSLDRIEDALSTVGLRGVLCYETSDRDGKEIARQGLRENERYIRKCRAAKSGDPDHLFDALCGLHASFTLEDDTLEAAAAQSHSLDRGCHIHLSEDPVDARLTREKFGSGLAERLQKFGILGDKTLTAHGIHLQEAEKDLLAASGAMLAHTPQSNMNNAVGRTDIFGYLRRGVLTGLGTDGMSGDLKPDIRTAMWLHKHDLRDSNAGWNEVQQMVLKNNPAIYRRLSGQKVGRIEAGWLADLILLDYYPPTPFSGENFWGHFLFGIIDAEVHLTMVNGAIVMQNGVIPGLDEAQIAAEARRVAKGVWERFG